MSDGTEAAKPGSQWTFLSNHTHVLVCIARNPDIRVSEISDLVGITERAVQRIIADLEQGGYLRHERLGRRNHYEIDLDRPLRHPLEDAVTLGELLGRLTRDDGTGSVSETFAPATRSAGR